MNNKLSIVKEIFGLYNKVGDEYLFSCPVCKHHKRKLSININKMAFKCWKCDFRGKLTYLVNRFGNSKNKSDWSQICGEVDLSSDFLQFDIVAKETDQSIQLPKEYVCLAKKKLPFNAKEPLQYLLSRGITKETILFYKIGFCDSGEYRNRVVLPSFNEEGKCNFFTSRSYIGDWLKYKNPNISKNIIFNDLLIDWTSPISIVEGPFDSFKLSNSIPLLGSTLRENSRLFQKLAEYQNKIYLALDKDAALKSIHIIQKMIEYGLDVWKIDTSGFEDIGALPKDIADSLKDSAIELNLENMFKLLLEENEV